MLLFDYLFYVGDTGNTIGSSDDLSKNGEWHFRWYDKVLTNYSDDVFMNPRGRYYCCCCRGQ